MNTIRWRALGTKRADARQGFALIITVILVAFLVLILVSLATLTRVETQVAGNSQQLAQARQNALVALNIALGQLQKYAGPDQRVTATASLGGATNLNGLTTSEDGARHWVGVWGRDSAASAVSGNPVLLNWLVSGNENARFTSMNGAPPFSGVSGVDFTGKTAIAGLAEDSNAFSDLGTAAQRWRLLVGANSVGPEVSRYVAAPLMPFVVAASQVPGFAGNDSVVVGRYAWWVGDENVKARVNLVNRNLGGSDERLAASFVVAQRSALEWVDRDGANTPLGSLYPSLSNELTRVLTLPQLAYVSTDPATVGQAAKVRYHDLTTHSYSLLADTARGGLKKDLNRALAVGVPSAGEMARGADYAPAANRSWLFTPNNSGADSYGVPTWGLLRTYAGRQVNPSSAIAVQAPVRASEGGHFFYDDAGVSPVITYAGVGFDFTSPGADMSSTYPAPINLNLFPVVVLWNPYTVPLASAEYTLAIGTRTASRLQLRETDTSGPVRVELHLQRANFSAAGPNGYFRFKVTAPVIQPGESVIFMLAGNTIYQPGITELVEGLNPSASASYDTGAQLVDAMDAATAFVTYATNGAGTAAFGGGEIDAVLAAFDPSGVEPSGQDPETAATAWFTAAQRAGAPGVSASVARELAADTTTADMRFGLRLRANFPDSGSGLQLQWIAHASARSPLMVRSKLDTWLNGASTAGYSSSYAGRFGAANPWPDFNTTTARASTGTGLSVTAGGPILTTLWEFPSPQLGLLSVGQLQHAPLAILGTYPSYALGNSAADFRIPRTDTVTTANTHLPTSTQMVTVRINSYYDLSWHLNRAMWDRYFFSSVPTGAAPTAGSGVAWTQGDIDADNPLPNSRMHYYRGGTTGPLIGQLVRDATDPVSDPYNQAAANLLVAGGFNVNSTSEQAWRAVLAGVNQLAYNPQTRASGSALQAAFSRFANPTADDALGTPWQGYRQLTEDQIAQLAANIVAQVKLRGPFLSLADFVNRRLAADTTGLKGALQAAIDATTTGAAANLATTAPFNANRVANAPGTGESFDAEAMRNDVSNTINAAHRSRSAYAPKFLTQADILSTLGPILTARSDTFVIRAYGEVTNPLLADTDPSYVTSRAWCEAVVQRLPDYMDMDDAALTTANLGAALLPSATNFINREFGRRFQVVSFRWLNPSDI